jgi:hypothetical protein
MTMKWRGKFYSESVLITGHGNWNWSWMWMGVKAGSGDTYELYSRTWPKVLDAFLLRRFLCSCEQLSVT